MSTPFLGQVNLFAFGFAPKGWALCNGQSMAIQSNAALFSLLGTIYGGNGISTFNLPNLQGLCPMGFSGSYVQGSQFGELNHTLSLAELPQHTHPAQASNASGTLSTPVGNFPAASTANPYSTTSSIALPSSSVGSTQAHSNQSPYLVVNFCISLTGIFPSRN